MSQAPVVVVGAGAAGLATAAALREGGREVQVLERAERVGASWAGRYDSLHLHTVRWLSGLPGVPIPRSYGKWVARDDLVQYLATYARKRSLRPELGTTVTRIDRDGDDSGWLVRTDRGDRTASRVVVATGYSHTPRRPAWPGVETFTGDLRHSADYREPSSYAGKRVLVVGAGNSATEIALDLLRVGAEVTLSVRTPPNIVRRDTLGVPSQVFGIALKRVPERFMDPLTATLRRISVPDLSEHGLPRSADPYSTFRRTGTVPILDTGIVDAVRTGRVRVVPATVSVDGPTVHLADGSSSRPDAVVAATGFTTGLEPVVGHLDVLDRRGVPTVHSADQHPAARGLHFVGIKAELSGLLREIGLEARRVGRALAERG
ncbi:MAG TPA: NAD(P)/FAD-dependent oxidoreductase [Actinomycetes bacterium]|nr:NAD(P)/FAD-dependent oxidoreductase [Actinomycetes bacterium]